MRKRIYHINTKTTEDPGSFFHGILSHPLIIGLWVLGTLLVSIQLIHSAITSKQIIKNRVRQEELLKEEEKRGLELMRTYDETNTDFAKEKIIRDELHMQKPGETILQLPSSPSPSPFITND